MHHVKSKPSRSRPAACGRLSRSLYCERIERLAVIDELEFDAIGHCADEQFDLVSASVRPCILDNVADDLIECNLKLSARLTGDTVSYAELLESVTEEGEIGELVSYRKVYPMLAH